MSGFAKILMVLWGVIAAVKTASVDSPPRINLHNLLISFDSSSHQMEGVILKLNIGDPGDSFACLYPSSSDYSRGAPSSEQGRDSSEEEEGEEEEEEEEENKNKLSTRYRIFSRCEQMSKSTTNFLSFVVREPLPRLSLPWNWLSGLLEPKMKGDTLLDLFYTQIE